MYLRISRRQSTSYRQLIKRNNDLKGDLEYCRENVIFLRFSGVGFGGQNLRLGIFLILQHTWNIEYHIVDDVVAPANNADTNALDFEK